MKLMRVALIVFLIAGSLMAQEKTKPRIFVTDSKSWEVSGGFGGNRDAIGGGSSGGARPQTAEIVKTFNERCPTCVITLNKEKADYIIILEHEGGKGFIRKDNKFALFNKDGEAIKSGSTRSLGNSVKEACGAIQSDWKSRESTETMSEDKKN
ncbi:MAG TPA: hypothetical protein VID27_06265 [Blastocatellia bacterium]